MELEGTAESQPKFTDYDIYHEAGGVLDEDGYSLFKKAIEGDREFQPIHIKQAQVLAKNANLSDPDKVAITASAYALLRETESRVIGLSSEIQESDLSRPESSIMSQSQNIPVSDQEIFAQALLATQGKEAYDVYRAQLPHIFNKKK